MASQMGRRRERGGGSTHSVCETSVVELAHVDGKLGSLSVQPRVPLNSIELLHCLGSSVLGEVGVKVSFPVVGGDGESSEGLDVGLDVREEDVEASHRDLEVQEEVGSLTSDGEEKRSAGVLRQEQQEDAHLIVRHGRESVTVRRKDRSELS